jgi:MFS family permease
MSLRVKRILLSHTLTGFICWYGIEKVFQKTIGISVLTVSVLAISYIAISALLNIPTGVLADKYGRKYALCFAGLALFLCSLTGGLAHSVWQYFISVMLWGVFYTTQNGANSAILYDTLKEEGAEQSYARYWGVSNALFWAAIFVSSVLGAWVGSHLGLRTAYFITLIPNLLNIIVILSLHEPHRFKHEDSATSLSMAKQGFKFLVSSGNIMQLAGTFLLISLFAWTTNEFGQLYFIELGFGVFIVGLLNAFSGLFQSFGNFIGHKFSHVSIWLMTTLSISVFLLIFALPGSLRYISIGLFLAFVMLRQVFAISNDASLQHALPSNIRATTMSSIGALNDVILIFSYLCFGLVSRHYSVRMGYISIGLIGITLVLITHLILKKKHLKTS